MMFFFLFFFFFHVLGVFFFAKFSLLSARRCGVAYIYIYARAGKTKRKRKPEQAVACMHVRVLGVAVALWRCVYSWVLFLCEEVAGNWVGLLKGRSEREMRPRLGFSVGEAFLTGLEGSARCGVYKVSIYSLELDAAENDS